MKIGTYPHKIMRIINTQESAECLPAVLLLIVDTVSRCTKWFPIWRMFLPLTPFPGIFLLFIFILFMRLAVFCLD